MWFMYATIKEKGLSINDSVHWVAYTSIQRKISEVSVSNKFLHSGVFS